MARWGLIPARAKDASRQSNAINARVESIAEKPTFKSAFKSRRCLIPATGYYEWATELGQYKPKQPFYISNTDESSIAIAGIYEEWINPQTSSPLPVQLLSAKYQALIIFAYLKFFGNFVLCRIIILCLLYLNQKNFDQ